MTFVLSSPGRSRKERSKMVLKPFNLVPGYATLAVADFERMANMAKQDITGSAHGSRTWARVLGE